MAHECPTCFFVCNCNGDFDDLVLNYEKDIARCNCCDEDDTDWEDFDDEDELEAPAASAEQDPK